MDSEQLTPSGQPPVATPTRDRFSTFVAEQLRCYVYLLRDPHDGQVFYVGKGTGDRVFAHARDAIGPGEDTPKRAHIRKILSSGSQVVTELLRFGIDDKTAFEVEAAAIELLGLTDLLNAVEGHGSLDHGRMPTDEAIRMFEAEPIDVTSPAILIRPSRLWYRGMPDTELLEATAGWWKVGIRRERAQYAFAVVHGVVRGVWKVDRWRPRSEGDRGWGGDPPGRPRWGFDGSSDPELASIYLGRSLAHYWKRGAQSPFVYVNC